MLTLDYIREIIVPLGETYPVKKIWLFGSYAKGTANENSDIDLLVEKKEGIPFSLLTLSSLRQDAVESFNLPVDIVTTSGVDDAFLDEISGSEILLYEE